MAGHPNRKSEARLTAEQLRDMLSYDPETGIWTWLKPTSRRVHPGYVVSYNNGKGYISVGLNGRHYLVHRLAFLYMTGEWPKAMDKNNNRWSNLRGATKSQNGANRSAQRNNTHGTKCVYLIRGYYVRDGRDAWRAEITVDGQHRHIGYFRTVEEASAAYADAARKHFGEFAKAA